MYKKKLYNYEGAIYSYLKPSYQHKRQKYEHFLIDSVTQLKLSFTLNAIYKKTL